MDVIKLTRQLGAAIQQDERYLAFQAARKANEDDADLNAIIGKLNLIQMSYQQEMQQDAPDQAKLESLDQDFQNAYGELSLNPNMANFEKARAEVDELMNYIMQLLSLCVNGEDPETCEPAKEEHDCGGNCSACGGCH